jgi:maleate isomerase
MIIVDGTADRKRLGLLVPSSNTIMEQDLQRGLSDIANVHTARMYLVETTEKGESAMLDEYFPRAVEDIASLKPHAVVFGCTSAGALRGRAYDKDLCERIQARTGAAAISTIDAASSALAESGHQRVSVLTPYIDELNVRVRASIEDAGVEVIEIAGLGITDNFRLAEPTPSEIANHAVELIRRTNPSMLFISCTNFRSLEAAQRIESATGVPVMTSNLAVIRAVEKSIAEKV